MSTTETAGAAPAARGADVMGHPRQLWMLFMTEFWERFSFYGMRWALTLYIVAQFFGGYAADRLIGYQRSILLGAVVTAIGLFMITVPNQEVFLMGLAVVITGNGLFKPNISTMVGKLYAPDDDRRDRGFTIFYMGINAGALVAPLLTGWLATSVFGVPDNENYKAVFIATGIGMLISLLWFWFGRRDLGEIGRPPEGKGMGSMLIVLLGVAICAPTIYFLLSRVGAEPLQYVLSGLFVLLAIMLIAEGVREGKDSRDKVVAMILLFAFNIFFWCFFEQAGSSFNFLAENIVDRDFGGWEFPVGWFQSVNPAGIVLLAPVMAVVWAMLSRMKAEPSVPRKFGLGLILNGLSFTVLMYALSSLVQDGHIPFWPLALTYVIQTVGELCLSPIGLSMVTKLAPLKYVGLAMGGWFLSTAIGNNLSGIVAAMISGETGMTVESARAGFTLIFYILMAAGIFLFLVAPFIRRLMHGVK
jgi:POT family proton-dependent oligopeptide transporter